MIEVRLSLISHTNVGKTTLARTLLRKDVGQVLDQAHVTEESEAFVLLESGDRRLVLWDTPGFGNVGALMRRLRHERDPLGWFLHQVWDRMTDRPLWSSQKAARNVREHSDVVLYLVNATERPEDAGYVSPELELLGWMERPVLLLLNQVRGGTESELERWSSYASRWPVVRGVMSLDAFTRCWVEEDLMLERAAELLPEPKREAMRDLAEAWRERNLDAFRQSAGHLATYLARVAAESQPLAESGKGSFGAGVLTDLFKLSGTDKRRAMKALNEQLDRDTERLMGALVAIHGLEGSSYSKIEARIREFQVRGGLPVNERSGAVAGAVVSGALGGLAADVLSGGLSLGGGMIAGGILGALGGSALARGYRWVGLGRDPSVRWSGEFLDRLAAQVLLRYLAVAHFGRGRGGYSDREQPAHWVGPVEAEIEHQRSRLRKAWARAEEAGAEAVREPLREFVEGALIRLLGQAYPLARDWLESFS